MRWTLSATLLALAIAAAGPAPAEGVAGHDRTGSTVTPCFFLHDWEGWKAPNGHTLYLGVVRHQVYEVQLSGDSALLRDPDAHLVSRTYAPNSVCSARDLQLMVKEPFGGVGEGLIAETLVKLTPEQIKAIPPKYLPPNW
ncbi:MAG TPA: hypothetical protein VGH03_00195 [Caulobacteraceae bacterium]|jgi:hypothetical protein